MNSIRIIKACELTPELTLQWQDFADNTWRWQFPATEESILASIRTP